MPSIVVHSTYCAFFNEKYKRKRSLLILPYLKCCLDVTLTMFTEWLIQTLHGSFHFEFRFHVSNFILGLKLLKKTTAAGWFALYFYYCIFVDRLILVILLFVQFVHWNFNFCSGLKSFADAELNHFHYFYFFFLCNGSDHNPNVFCWILSKMRALIVNVCGFLCMLSTGVYIFEGVWVFALKCAVCCCTLHD